MADVSRRRWSATVAVTVGLAAATLAGVSVAAAATSAKPGHPASQDKSPGKLKARTVDGIVQSVSVKAMVVRELDGQTVSVPVAASTRVFVNGKRASLRNVNAGFVATAAWKDGKPARVLHAFDLRSRQPVTVGVVDSVSSGVLVVTETGGDRLSIPVNAKTRVLLDGKPSKLAAVKPGYTVVISAKDAKGDRPPHELRFLRPV